MTCYLDSWPFRIVMTHSVQKHSREHTSVTSSLLVICTVRWGKFSVNYPGPGSLPSRRRRIYSLLYKLGGPPLCSARITAINNLYVGQSDVYRPVS